MDQAMSERAIRAMKDNPELTKLIAESIAAFNRLTPEQQKQHRQAQRKSWVIGEMLLAHPEMTREHAERIYSEIEP